MFFAVWTIGDTDMSKDKYVEEINNFLIWLDDNIIKSSRNDIPKEKQKEYNKEVNEDHKKQ